MRSRMGNRRCISGPGRSLLNRVAAGGARDNRAIDVEGVFTDYSVGRASLPAYRKLLIGGQGRPP